MRVLVWVALVASLYEVNALGAIQNMCNSYIFSNPKEKLDEKMKLPETYKLSSIFTDWIASTTKLATETATKDKLSTAVSNRDGLKSKWIKTGSSVVLVNGSDCAVTTAQTPFPALSPRIVALLKTDASSVAAIVNDVVKFSQDNLGTYQNVSMVMSGVEGVHWVSCVNGTDKDNAVQIEVVFAGPKSFPPSSASVDNPLMLFVRFSEFRNISNATDVPLVSSSFEIERYEFTAADSAAFETPAATACANWPTKALPVVFDDPTSFVVQSMESSARVFYSPSKRISIVSVDSLKDDMIPFFEYKSGVSGADLFIHDFNYGYSYSLSSTRCVDHSAILKESADVKDDGKGLLSLGSLADTLKLNVSPWGNYGNVVIDGKSLAVWRYQNATTNQTTEARLDGTRLVQLLTYQKDSSVPTSSLLFVPAPLPSLTTGLHRARDCFAVSKQTNNTFAFNVTGKLFADVHAVGQDVVTSGLAHAFTKVATINHMRIDTFFDTTPSGGLAIFFTVFDKSLKAPANTGYNYTDEKTTDEMFAALNKTISAEDWKFTVESSGKSEDWTVPAKSLSQFPIPPPPPGPAPYVGYSGGSMFVLGLFSLILGCAIGAGGLFFVTKRQRISTLAYQVFE